MKTVMILCAVTLSLHAAPGDLDLSFTPNVSGGNGSVLGATVQHDGRILVAGAFTSVDGQTRNGIARLNADGTMEDIATFDPGTGAANNPVNASPGGIVVTSAAVQDDGKILLGGYFPSFAGQPRSRIARLNANGSLEALGTFDSGSGVSGPLPWGGAVFGIGIQPDGKILLAGEITGFDGQVRHGYARLNPDGTVESTDTFKTGDGAAGGLVRCIAIQDDGKILLGGSFAGIDGQARSNIARLNPDGAIESLATFNAGTPHDSNIYTLAVQSDGKILIGGDFTSVNGQPRNRIARLHSDGRLESTTDFKVGSGASNSVFSLALQANGKILLGGTFFNVDNQPRNGIARLNSDGSIESLDTFNPGTGVGVVGSRNVNGVAIQTDGKILVCGDFTTINGEPRNKIARLLNDPASQSLTASSSSRLQWMRSGSAPEVSQVTFERLIDGAWVKLGSGSGFAYGWELNGINLVGTETLRARGRTTGGFANGSQGLVETITTLSPSPDVTVEYPSGTRLESGIAVVNFGPVTAGASKNVEFTLSSTGTSPLSEIIFAKGVDGSPQDFTVIPPQVSTLPRDTSVTFTVSFSPTSHANRTAALFILSNDPDENPFTIQLTGTQATPLEGWRQSHFGSPYNVGPGADLNDPDGDGIVNLLEFGTGSDPLAATIPIGELVRNGSKLEFTHQRPVAALTEVSYRLEWSESLGGTWSIVGGTPPEVLTDDGVMQTVKHSVPAGSGGKRFVRLRVTRL